MTFNGAPEVPGGMAPSARHCYEQVHSLTHFLKPE